MKEKFEDRRLFGKLLVSCVFDDGTKRVWDDRKEIVVKKIVAIVEAYAAKGYSLTLRQLHYQFVGHHVGYVNHDSAYKKLGKILDDCRYSGLIDWDAIVDRGRKPYLRYWCYDVKHALEDTKDQYRVDRQAGQETHVEVWTEKDALSDILSKPADKYHVRLVVNKGYTSSSAIYDSYERFIKCINDGQFVTILYFGDHDPSGLDMIRDIKSRLAHMFENGSRCEDDWESYFQVVPIGLTMKQIKQYKLPPNPTKMTDARSPAYVEKFGRTCWEVDALDPDVLVNIVEKNIIDNIDVSLYEEQIVREEKDIKTLEKFIKNANGKKS